MDALVAKSGIRRGNREMIEAFLSSLSITDDEAEQTLQAESQAELSKIKRRG